MSTYEIMRGSFDWLLYVDGDAKPCGRALTPELLKTMAEELAREAGTPIEHWDDPAGDYWLAVLAPVTPTVAELLATEPADIPKNVGVRDDRGVKWEHQGGGLWTCGAGIPIALVDVAMHFGPLKVMVVTP
jgi:hypothetical protein